MNSRFWGIFFWIIIILLGLIPVALLFFMFISPKVVDQIPYPAIRDAFNAITKFLTT